jgi:lysosomal Pro-X carboxypeptidase
MPVDYGLNGTMFPASQFDYKEYKETCQHKYGVQPRPHWITTYYGGQVWILSLSLSLCARV